MCVNEFYFCICFVKVNFQILEKIWKSEFPNIRKRCQNIYLQTSTSSVQKEILDNTLVTSIQKMYMSKAGYGINDFYPFFNILHLFQSSSNYYKDYFFSISESFVSVKRVHLFYLLFIIIFVSKQSLDSPTLMTLILPTGRVF